MTGEPKTLTLEEALVLTARDTQYSLVAMPDEDSDEPVAVSWVLLGAFDDFGPFTSWVQAAEYALGVRVVARDEAAELREENHTLRTEADGWLKRVELLEAAIREWVEATSDAEMFELDQSNAYGTDHADAEDRVEAAVKALRALAATEEQS